MLRFSGGGVSDVGRVRDHNEDAGFMSPYLALVADGVGGSAAGEVASATAAYAVSATALAGFGAEPAEILRRGVAAARRGLVAGVRQDARRAGMATTLTALATDGKRLVLAHLGDSRAYLYRDGRLQRLSADHTYVQSLIEQGQLTSAQARRHPWRNVVVRSMHADLTLPFVDPDVVEIEPVAGDRYLLASDGLTDLIDEERIAEVLELSDAHSAAARLVAQALSAGGTDNITCLVFDLVDGPQVVGDGQVLGAMLDPANVVDATTIRLA